MSDPFLKKIKFDTVFSHIKYKDSFRTQTVERIKETEGYIIGSCYKYDGEYYPPTGSKSFYEDDWEPGGLANRVAVHYWKVVTELNKEYLVPKSQVKEVL